MDKTTPIMNSDTNKNNRSNDSSVIKKGLEPGIDAIITFKTNEGNDKKEK